MGLIDYSISGCAADQELCPESDNSVRRIFARTQSSIQRSDLGTGGAESTHESGGGLSR
jgi:hypothetical protein